MASPSPLISTAELAARIGEPALRIIDASWHLDGRDSHAGFEQARLPGAVFFDLDAVSDHTTDLPHMLPTAAAFAEAAGALGIAETDTVVVYDTLGLVSAARVWWMFSIMGATDVRVLDGGLPKWRAEGRSVDTGPAPTPSAAHFRARFEPAAVATLADIASGPATGKQILDARSAGRFAGAAPEPRPGLRGGHMPGALNLPFADLLNADSTMKRGAALADAFAGAGVDPARPVMTTCGSGVTAAILSLGLTELGRSSRLYDGSWAEWGGRDDTTVVTAQSARLPRRQ